MANYPMQLVDMQNDVMSRLNDVAPANSVIGRLADGAGGVTTTTAVTIAQYLNDEAEKFVRYCYPLYDTGTYSLPVGTEFIPFSLLTVASGQLIWAAIEGGVTWNGVALVHSSRESLGMWFPNWSTTANGTPIRWLDSGEDGVAVWPKPSAQQTLSVKGLASPKLLVNAGDTLPIAADLVKYVVFGACEMIAKKVLNRDDMNPRVAAWAEEAQSGRDAQLIRLWKMNPELAAAYFPSAPKGA